MTPASDGLGLEGLQREILCEATPVAATETVQGDDARGCVQTEHFEHGRAAGQDVFVDGEGGTREGDRASASD
jgi:hypothetical protein